jgi:hypothetical protein
MGIGAVDIDDAGAEANGNLNYLFLAGKGGK